MEEIKRLAATADGATRHKIMTDLHKLAYSMETSTDTSLRYGHLVRAMNLNYYCLISD